MKANTKCGAAQAGAFKEFAHRSGVVVEGKKRLAIWRLRGSISPVRYSRA
jgi:hypothetical protein